MANFNDINTHISRTFNRELEDLRNALLVMGGEIEVQLQNALEALRNNDRKHAEKVILNDVKINAMELEIDQECLRILATRNPTASDLRLVMSVSKMVVELESMGDEIEQLAGFITSTDTILDDALKLAILRLGEDVLSMMRDTFDAFARQDLQTAYDIFEQEKMIDEKYAALNKKLASLLEQQPAHLHHWLAILDLPRGFERIADHCIKICEYLVYLAGGKDLRHHSNKKIQKKIQSLLNT
jgi:phosphate transport system protein